MSERFVFSSTRRFVISFYLHSHGLLLLRSVKTNEHKTRIDILFQSVRAMEMHCWFDGATIEEVEVDFLAGLQSNPAEMIEPGNRVYAVRGTGWTGFIVGGIVRTLEDDGNALDPSGLTGEFTEGNQRLFSGTSATDTT
jgi:hypothetical protein